MAPSPSPNRQASLFSAKTTRPRLPKILLRVECLNKLNGAKDHKVVYISGFAGMGKTTLALAHLKQSRARSVWVTLDENDNEPVAFFQLMAGAFAVAFPRTPLTPPLIPTNAPFDPAVFARTYFSNLFSQISVRYDLVLDDLHSIREDGPIPSILEALMESLPPKARIILLSRNLPPPFLTRWTARRQMFQLDQESLRFSVEEVQALFTEVLRVAITRDQAMTLHRMTEGWVTGLVLMKDRIDKRPGSIVSEPIPPSPSGTPLTDYFYHEVYRRIDPAVQDLMIRSSLFDSFSLKSLGTLPNTSADLETPVRFLVRRYLLSEVPMADGTRFRYHPLLRQFLRERVQELPAGEQKGLVDQAGSTLLAEGEVEKAVDLYLTHRHNDQAIHLIEKVGLGYVFQGRRLRLRQWIRSLPPAQYKNHPWLHYLLGASKEFEAPKEAEAHYQRALLGFEKTDHVEGQLWALGSLIFLAYYRGNDCRPMKKYAWHGRQLLKKYKGACSPMARSFFLFADGLSAVYVEADPHRGLRKCLASAELARQNGLLPLYVMVMTFAGYAGLHCGKLQIAMLCLKKAEGAIPREKLDPAIYAQLLLTRGVIESFQGNAEQGMASVTESEEVCLKHGLETFFNIVQCNLARHRMKLGMGEAEVMTLFEPIQRRTIERVDRFVGGFTSYCQSVALLSAGKLSQALTHAEEAVRLLKEHGSLIFLNLCTYIQGAVLGEMGETEGAERHLLASLRLFEKARCSFYIFWVLLQLAKVSLDRGNEKRAKRYLARALRLGRTEEYREVDGLLPRTKSILVTRALEWNLEPEYVRMLMEHWKVAPMIPLKIHTLGRFEVLLHDWPVPREAWRGRKTQHLLLALIALGGKQVSKGRISDLLWPEAEGDLAVTNFHTTLHRLQSVLGGAGKTGSRFADLKGGYLSINPAQCWSDCCAFDEEIRQARLAETRAQWGKARSHLEKARDLYQGEYLPGFEELWIVSRREELHRKWLWAEQRLKSFSQSA